MLRLRAMGAAKTCPSIRSVSFNTKSEVEVYQLANDGGIMLYGEYRRYKKRLNTTAVDVPKSTPGTST